MEDVVQDRILFPVKVVGWVLAAPIHILTWVVTKLRRPINPEKALCPACLFRECTIRCVPVEEADVVVTLEHQCLRCFAKFYSPVAYPAKMWSAKTSLRDQAARVKAILKTTTL